MTKNEKRTMWAEIAMNVGARIEETPVKFAHADPALVARIMSDDVSRLKTAQDFVAQFSR